MPRDEGQFSVSILSPLPLPLRYQRPECGPQILRSSPREHVLAWAVLATTFAFAPPIRLASRIGFTASRFSGPL